MPQSIQKAVLDLVVRVSGGSIATTSPAWLKRPGKIESGKRWPLLRAMYHDLTGMDLPEVMPSSDWPPLDGFLQAPGSAPRVIEVDEGLHFNNFRGMTLRRYPAGWPVAFDVKVWVRQSHAEPKQNSGALAKPVPPLFPGEGGRHRQRAFRDALADILPPDHGYLPTLRIADFEVKGWIGTASAARRMEELLDSKLAG